MAVAMLREGYVTKCRFFDDSDVEVDVLWYKCAPNAKELDVPCFVRPLHWEPNPYIIGTGIGEVFNADVKVYPYRTLAGATGQHKCGTDTDFISGGRYDPHTPPIPRTPEGVGLCCSGPPGGVVVGGEPQQLQDSRGVLVGGTIIARFVGSLRDNCLISISPGQPIPADLERVTWGTATPGPDAWFCWIAQPPFPPSLRLTYIGYQPGTLEVFTGVPNGTCTNPTFLQLYSGVANDAWTKDFSPSPSTANLWIHVVTTDPVVNFIDTACEPTPP